MFCEVVSRLSLVVGNRELGVVVDRNGAELGDIPRTLIFRVGIAYSVPVLEVAVSFFQTAL